MSDRVIKAPVSGWSLSRRLESLDLLEIARRRWRWLAVGFLIGIAIGLTYYFSVRTTYESSTKILVMRKDPKVATRGVESMSDVEGRVTEDLLSTHMQILQSPQIVGNALSKYGYDELPSITEKLWKDETPVSFVIDRLYVTRGGSGQAKTAHVINAAFRHTSEDETYDILSAIIEEYKEFLTIKFEDVNKEAANLIGEAKVDLASDLEDAEEVYRTFREKAPLLWNGIESGNIHRVRFEELQSAMSDTRLQTASARARLEIVEDAIQEQDRRGATDAERLALLDDKHVERLTLLVEVDRGDANNANFQSKQPKRLEIARSEHQSILMLILKEKTLVSDLGPRHPSVLEVRRQIDAAQNFMDQQNLRLGKTDDKPVLTARGLVTAYVELLKQDLLTIEKRHQQLDVLAAEEQEKAKALVVYELRGETLRKEVDRKHALYEIALERLREINLVKDYGGFITEIIAPIEIGEKVAPKLSISLLLGALLGICAGASVGLVRELRDSSFQGVDDLAEFLNLPVWSSIPRLAPDGEQSTIESIPPVDRAVWTFHRPRSREAEVFRGLRTSLVFESQRNGCHVIAMTSPMMGDGKSTVAANLAVSLAQAGRNVLLIDCDLRRPTIHKLFGLKDAQGLSTLLTSDIDPPEVMAATAIETLTIIPSGPLPGNPAELLASHRFAELIEGARQKFDFVLLDCPPVLAVADPCIVATKADGVLLTVNPHLAKRPDVARTRQLLADVQATILAVVANRVVPNKSQGYGNYSYGYATEENAAYYHTEETTVSAK